MALARCHAHLQRYAVGAGSAHPNFATANRKFLQRVVSRSRPFHPSSSSGIGTATPFSTVTVYPLYVCRTSRAPGLNSTGR